MKSLIALVALVAFVGFVGFTHAADKPAKPHHGMVTKVSSDSISYKGKKEEHTAKVDAKTKVTLEGKEAKIADVKVDMYVAVTEEDGTATMIAASAKAPEHKPKAAAK